LLFGGEFRVECFEFSSELRCGTDWQRRGDEGGRLESGVLEAVEPDRDSTDQLETVEGRALFGGAGVDCLIAKAADRVEGVGEFG